jgi:hypothetical protein
MVWGTEDEEVPGEERDGRRAGRKEEEKDMAIVVLTMYDAVIR